MKTATNIVWFLLLVTTLVLLGVFLFVPGSADAFGVSTLLLMISVLFFLL